jgi:hypothetical protein
VSGSGKVEARARRFARLGVFSVPPYLRSELRELEEGAEDDVFI